MDNGRTDLAVFWKDQVIPIELKMNHNARSQSDGLRQIARYTDELGQKRRPLILFEKKPPKNCPGKRAFVEKYTK